MKKDVKESSRIYYLDFMRGLAIFFMIMQHAMIVHEKTGGEGKTIIGNIFILLGTAPAAPVFMFIMGLFIMKSKKSSRDVFIRGVKLFGLGYALNLLRFSLPMLIAGEPGAISMFFGVDILQLAGLSFMMAAFLRKYAKNKFVFPILIVVTLLVSPYLWGKFGGNFIFAPLWGTGGDVAFPFFPWCIYPMLGMYLSPHLLHPSLASKAKRFLLVWGIALGVAGLLTLDLFPASDYSRYGFGASFIIISFVFLWLLVSEFLVNKIAIMKENMISKALFYWSENVTNVYIIQWVIYGWSMLLIGANEQNDFVAVLIGLIVLLLTHMLLKYTPISRLIPKI
ncbi:heparan-alpha-glucosaminide N-acetyltransferase domain-containing protein [Wukongibacter baidiensis]|uniref:acyltransferase family protein n=1 Tax=Wukongibacter baidiensis TaxID=1723361 RepID=UPI003D7F564C